jgi:hypothetical protein
LARGPPVVGLACRAVQPKGEEAMFSKNCRFSAALAVAVAVGVAEPAYAQISIGIDTGALPNAVCVGSTDSETLFVSNDDDCNSAIGAVDAPFMSFNGDGIIFDANTGEATFNRLTTFNSQTVLNGVASFTDTVSFSGANATFATPTTFTFPSTFQAQTTFNGTTNFTAGMTTTNITNSGTINSTNVNVTGSFTAAPGTTINMGGVNRIQGVAAGVNDLDAVNVAQLNAATSGITADVTALETVTTTHTTQIAALQTTTTNQATQITALQAADVATAARIDTLEADQASLIQDVGTLFDLRRRDRREARRGTAAAVAMSEAPMPSRDGGISYSLHGATYRGQHAIGGSLKYRVSHSFAVDAGLSHAGHKDTAARIGVSGEF